MTDAGHGSSASAEDDLLLLNDRQAWQLLGLDTIFFRSYRRKATFGWERLFTGLSCHIAVGETGIFGRSVAYPQSLLSEILRRHDTLQLIELGRFPTIRPLLSNRVHYGLISRPADASFAQAAAFLDIVSDWITCDDLYEFLSGPSRRRLWAGTLIRVRTH